ncbi:hypothetical protein ACWD4O_48185 [Streptomyces sp. NPDC002623]
MPPQDPAAAALAYAGLHLLTSTPSFTRWTQEHGEEMRDGPAFCAEIGEAAALAAGALARGFADRPAGRRCVHSPVTTF